MSASNNNRVPSMKLKPGDMNGPMYIEKIESVKNKRGATDRIATVLCECGLVSQKPMIDLNRRKYKSCSHQCVLFRKNSRKNAVAMNRKKHAKTKEARPVVIKQLVGMPKEPTPIRPSKKLTVEILDIDSFIQKRIEAKRIQLREEIIAHIENFKFASN